MDKYNGLTNARLWHPIILCQLYVNEGLLWLNSYQLHMKSALSSEDI